MYWEGIFFRKSDWQLPVHLCYCTWNFKIFLVILSVFLIIVLEKLRNGLFFLYKTVYEKKFDILRVVTSKLLQIIIYWI